MDPKTEEPRNTISISIDPKKLKEVVAGLGHPTQATDWCVACGAGKASAKLDIPENLVQHVGTQFLDAKGLHEFLSNLPGGEAAWCVACGAGAAAAPMAEVGKLTPTPISDAVINELAEKLIGTVCISK